MTVQVKNARRGKLRLAFGVVLTPGMNDVDAADWAQCRDHPVTCHYLQRGDVNIIAAASGPSANPIPLVREKTTPSEPDGPDAARYGEPISPPLPIESEDPPPPQTDTLSNEYPVASAAAGALPDLPAMRAKDAITALLAIDDPNVLKQLLTIEARTTVIRGIMRRLGDLGG